MPGKKPNKVKVYTKFQELLVKFKNILLCDINELPADVVHKIRHLLKKKSHSNDKINKRFYSIQKRKLSK